MKRKLLLRTLAICMGGSLLAGSVSAKEDSSGSSSSSDVNSSQSSTRSSSTLSSTSSTASSQTPQRLSQLMGATVKNSQGETLGQINDFVVNPTSGRIQFAILSLSDPSLSGKLTAVPWALVRPGSDASTLTLNVDKQKLASAQTFDASSWPDFSEPTWSHKIYSYYGVSPQGRPAYGGRVPTGGSETGGSSSDIEIHPPQNGTQPDGRGTFNSGPSSNPSNPVEKSTQP
jgi:sporulation protein YlmC with PRC-barrel domain